MEFTSKELETIELGLIAHKIYCRKKAAKAAKKGDRFLVLAWREAEKEADDIYTRIIVDRHNKG